jgi:hypothetical protein
MRIARRVFIDGVRETILRIRENPAGYRKAINDVRVANLRKFPYGIWFRERADGSVVIACLHGKRDRVLASPAAKPCLVNTAKKSPSLGAVRCRAIA